MTNQLKVLMETQTLNEAFADPNLNYIINYQLRRNKFIQISNTKK